MISTMGELPAKGSFSLRPWGFSWKIESFSRLTCRKHYSYMFMTGSHKWQVVIYPKGHNVDYFSMYLVGKSAKLPYAEFSLAVDQIEYNFSVRNGNFMFCLNIGGNIKSLDARILKRRLAGTGDFVGKLVFSAHHQFTTQTRSWGFKRFMPLTQLNDSQKGYIVNDTCIVEVNICVPGDMKNSKYVFNKVRSGKSAEVEPQVGVRIEAVADKDLVAASEQKTEPQVGVLSGKSAEVEPQVGVRVEAVAEIDLVAASEQRNEPKGVVDSADDVRVSMVTKQLGESMYLGAGQLFEEGRHQGVILDENYEDIGGFSVLKTQASFYKQLWLKYGHIASSQVLTDLYSVQVQAVTKLMTSIMDMYNRRFADMSSEMIDSWEKKIEAADKLEFNLRWLRECFEDGKKNFYREQNLRSALLERDQVKAQLIAAEEQLNLAKVKSIKVQENLSALDTKISALFSERWQDLEKGRRLFLFDDEMSFPPAPVLKQTKSPTKEDPTQNNPSKTMPTTGSAQETASSTSTSATMVAKRKSSGNDREVDGYDESSKKKVKTVKNESPAKDGSLDSAPPSTFRSCSNSSVPSSIALPSTEILENKSRDVLSVFSQEPNVTAEDLVKKFWAICHSGL